MIIIIIIIVVVVVVVVIIIIIMVAAVVMIMYLENALLFLQIKHIYINVIVCTSFCVLWRQYA
jgi:hypothetical protein